MCRSEPQTPEASMRTTASSAAIGSGSGRSSIATRPGSWKVTASMGRTLLERAAPEQRRRPVARVAVLVEEAVDRREHPVKADQAAPLDRAAGMVEAERDARVDVVGRTDALADRERRLVHELRDDPAEHQPRRITDPLGVQPAPVEEVVGRLAALAGQLRQPAAREHVEADRP